MNRYRHSINFRLERRKDKQTGELITTNLPINADITFPGERMFYYTGYRIDLSKWQEMDEKGEKVQRAMRGTMNAQRETASAINMRLNEIEAAVPKIFRKLEAGSITPTVAVIREELRELFHEVRKGKNDNVFWSHFENYIRDADLSPARKKQVASAMHHFQRFEKTLSFEITFETSDLNLIRKFERYLLKDGKDPRKYKHLPKKQRPKPKSHNSVIGILKKVRSFYVQMKKDHRIKENPFDDFEIGTEVYGRPIYTTKAERDYLYSLDVQSERLRHVRDLYIFQCFVGCRIGDFVKLTKGNIMNGVLEYIPRKTKDEKPVPVRVPLADKAKEILSRYADTPDGRLLPFITGQKYNVYLKELFELAGLTRIVTRLNPLTREEEQVRLCDIASSHMARRTFVGTLHKKVKDSVISSMTGHAPNSRAFTRYYDIDEESKVDAVTNFLE
ncbi:MAG: phage integrase SAM-like domain-containing protein [Prolixibacteraceae bacterium]